MSSGQNLKQFAELSAAFVLSAAIGLEREMRQKVPASELYTVVGTSAALFLLISKYGFMDVLSADRTVWLVTGIGTACGSGLLLRALAATFAYGTRVSVAPQLTAWPACPCGAS